MTNPGKADLYRLLFLSAGLLPTPVSAVASPQPYWSCSSLTALGQLFGTIWWHDFEVGGGSPKVLDHMFIRIWLCCL